MAQSRPKEPTEELMYARVDVPTESIPVRDNDFLLEELLIQMCMS